MVSEPKIQLQFGVNVHAADVYKGYQSPENTAFYPDPDTTKLRAALANYIGAPAETIVCGNGSDELVDLYIRAHKLKNAALKVAVVPPNYYQYDNYSERVGCQVVRLIAERSNLSPALLVNAGCTPKNSIIMLDNPSNPAGDVTPRPVLIDLLEAGYQVFADEAYYEFCGQTVVDLVPSYGGRLVVSRSFSKIAAMAGSRLGYAIAAPGVVQEFRRLKPLFNVTAEAQARGLFALSRIDEFQKSVEAMRRIKQATRRQIEGLGGFELLPSLDIYIIFKHPALSSEQLQRTLAETYGIMTYLYHGYRGEDVVRATVGRAEDMQRLVSALSKIG